MSANDKQSPLLTPPKKKKQHHNRARCHNCTCQQFQSDNAVISAVDSGEKTDVLVKWLSGSISSNSDDNKGEKKMGTPSAKKQCPHRLQASIAILNAIRDACRPYLESPVAPAPVSPTSGSSPTRNGNSNVQQPNFNTYQVTTYEDSFPSLSSNISSTAQPTMLVSRKKNKGAAKNLPQSVLSKPATDKPTLLIGRKKNKGPNKDSTKQLSKHGNVTSNGIAKSIKTTEIGFGTAGEGKVPAPKAKKRIKPVTISTGTTAFSPISNNNAFKSLKIEGNISSLPSQETTEVLAMESANQSEKKPPIVISAGNISPSMVGTTIVMNEFNSVSTIINPNNLLKLKRLVSIYSTILRSHLAPSLLLELHLLVRLVSLSGNSHTLKTLDESGDHQQPFSDIFQSEKSCRVFAAETFDALENIIVNIGHETIKLFLALPSLQRQCPELCNTLQDIIYAGNSELIFESDQKALGSNTNTPHLTLPFDHARDSRHNYRSPDLGRQFKEREQLRDTFLYQLRAFQDVRGKLMEHEQAEKRVGSIKHESREMLKNMSPGNTLWFVNFFCDLLCQIGLVPITETDTEVLKQIGDKKRLQKLHMRFTSKSGQTNKSSRKLRIDQKGQSSNANNTPEQSFTERGHQEFFFLFLQAGDSYKFNIHMKRRLAQMITEMSAVNDTKGLCEHISKTQMLAKFLGMLVFSPNWNVSSCSVQAEVEDTTNLAPINIKECIEIAWKQMRLVVVIPWVVQYLRMMKWYVRQLV